MNSTMILLDWRSSFMEFVKYSKYLAQTAKAPFDEKIKLLYSFFEEDKSAGIEFKSFVKMV